MYEYFWIPEAVNSAPNWSAVAPSELTRRMVTTSLGLASIHFFTSVSQEDKVPASSNEQEEWQRCHSAWPVELFVKLWTWAVRRRTPEESCIVLLKLWFPDVEKDVDASRRKGESCAPRWVMLLYGREQREGELLQAVWARMGTAESRIDIEVAFNIDVRNMFVVICRSKGSFL